MKKIYEVIRLYGGWYNFEKISQENNYIKVHNLRCNTDRKAINQAKKIIGDKKANVKIIRIPTLGDKLIKIIGEKHYEKREL